MGVMDYICFYVHKVTVSSPELSEPRQAKVQTGKSRQWLGETIGYRGVVSRDTALMGPDS